MSDFKSSNEPSSITGTPSCEGLSLSSVAGSCSAPSPSSASSAPSSASSASSDVGELTVGASLLASPTVRQAISTLCSELQDRSAQLSDVRPPDPGKKLSFEATIARANATRGRDMLYPYIGSGIGRGALVELADGSVKWDLTTGIGVNFFGHSDPDMVEQALIGGLNDTVKHGNLTSGEEPYAFAETLLRLAARQSELKHAFLSTSGAMANENALKVAFQKHAPASRVLAFSHCFMGRSIVMSQIGDSAANRVGIPLSVLVDYMPFWDETLVARMGKTRFIDMALAHLEGYLDRYPGQHAVFIFELMQGEGGFNVGDADYFRALMQVCKARGVAVWDDEIQTFGRGEEMFAYEYFGLGDLVDIFCVGKMTQACATLFTEAYNPQPGLLSGTFIGESVSFRVGQRVLQRLESGGFYGKDGLFAQHHACFREEVMKLASKHPDWFTTEACLPDIVGGIGGMMRFSPFGGRKAAIMHACKTLFDEGIIAFWCGHGPYHIRLLPPLPVMTLDMWPRIFAHIERGLARSLEITQS